MGHVRQAPSVVVLVDRDGRAWKRVTWRLFLPDLFVYEHEMRTRRRIKGESGPLQEVHHWLTDEYEREVRA